MKDTGKARIYIIITLPSISHRDSHELLVQITIEKVQTVLNNTLLHQHDYTHLHASTNTHLPDRQLNY